MQNILIRVPPDEHRDFKAKCAKEGKSMNEVIVDFIHDYLKKTALTV